MDKRNQSPGAGNFQRPGGHEQPRQSSPNFGGWQSLDWVVGLKVKITTALDDVIVGSVYTYCSQTNTLALIEDEIPNPSKPELKNLRIVKTSFIRDIAVVGRKTEDKAVADQLLQQQSNGRAAGGPFAKVQPAIGPVQIEGVVQKMKSATRSAGQSLAQRNVAVTAEAQELFDSLSKTLPIRWVNKSILVLDEVMIDPPYTPDSCHAETDSPALARIKIVVEGERKRQDAQRRAKAASNAPPEGERKGG
ncbi:anticodon-binding domain-containing protein [Myxozyma melibiosi]|uniref:Anticodon-binding domain-containing protein n=1 Tax=Myxozyma melibiosi TaxID=54550 RepID=A0ABR1FC09_9ASCO